jgi:L-2,4-diaminobutyrate decarboxylase
MPDDILSTLEADCAADVGRAFVAVASEYMTQSRSRGGRVSTLHTPAGLAARFDEPLPRGSRPVESIVRRIRAEVIPDSNHLFHPHYLGHQVSPPLPIALWMEMVTAALNQSAAVFEMSPVGTVVEHRVVSWMCELAGFGMDLGAGGTLTTGGSEATFTALLAARNAVVPESWMNGVGSDPPLLICGEHTHYAVTRAAGELGLGMKSVVPIRSEGYKMDTDALRQALDSLVHSGKRILAVVATAGSTPTGAFDDLETIGSMCDMHEIWLHVDGAHGAAALLSNKHRHRVRGIARARSIAFDPHKMMLLPLQAGMLLMRHEHELQSAFSQRAPYIFHSADGERTWDQGTRSFLCSRRVDAFKLWVALQRYGADGLGEIYDRLCDTTRYMWGALQQRPEFEVMHEPECNILCFRYVGTGSHADDTLDRLNRELRDRYNLSGEGWITGTNLDGRRVLRVTIMNPRTTTADVDDVLGSLATIGSEMIKEFS